MLKSCKSAQVQSLEQFFQKLFTGLYDCSINTASLNTNPPISIQWSSTKHQHTQSISVTHTHTHTTTNRPITVYHKQIAYHKCRSYVKWTIIALRIAIHLGVCAWHMINNANNCVCVCGKQYTIN